MTWGLFGVYFSTFLLFLCFSIKINTKFFLPVGYLYSRGSHTVPGFRGGSSSTIAIPLLPILAPWKGTEETPPPIECTHISLHLHSIPIDRALSDNVAMICTAYISCCHNGKEQPDTAQITLGMPLLDHLHNALAA